MTIEEFIQECNVLVKNANIGSSISDNIIRNEAIDIIIKHFKTKT